MGHARNRGSRGWVTARGHPATEIQADFSRKGTEELEGSPEGSVWIRGATQVGDVRDEDTPDYDTNVPAGGLLTGDQIRSSGGIRAVGPRILLAASTAALPSSDPTVQIRAAANRSWEAVESGLGNIHDCELLRPLPCDTDVDADDRGRLQFRADGDTMHRDSGTLNMVAGSATLKVVPHSIEHEDDTIEHEDDMFRNLLRAGPHYEGSVGLQVEGRRDGEGVVDAKIIVDSTDVWIRDRHRTLRPKEARMNSRTLHVALPRYVSKRFEWKKDLEVVEKEDSEGRRIPHAIVTRTDAKCEEADDGAQRDVLIPNAWARSKFAAMAQISVIIGAIKPFYSFPITFQEEYVQPIYANLYLPYTGWAIHPESGLDAAGTVPNPGKGMYSQWGIFNPAGRWSRIHRPTDFDRELATDYRRTIYCDYRK